MLTILLNGCLAARARLDIRVVVNESLVRFNPSGPLQLDGVWLHPSILLRWVVGWLLYLLAWTIVVCHLAVATEGKLHVNEFVLDLTLRMTSYTYVTTVK